MPVGASSLLPGRCVCVCVCMQNCTVNELVYFLCWHTCAIICAIICATEAHTDQHASMLCMVYSVLYGREYPLLATLLKKTRPLQDVTVSLCRRERTMPWYVHQYHMTLSITVVCTPISHDTQYHSGMYTNIT